ncbi:hypothetical protein NDU88_002780 [Pleurodeles waltl]|uniref:Uncharacterized protein n=1 Tax=Pleurodeles waltl TaxID=8319 RepID=A0AAV7MWP7_PLEWA|nr:hypothetical protein NDU88_002780 [Pleurodeles waltl]
MSPRTPSGIRHSGASGAGFSDNRLHTTSFIKGLNRFFPLKERSMIVSWPFGIRFADLSHDYQQMASVELNIEIPVTVHPQAQLDWPVGQPGTASWTSLK